MTKDISFSIIIPVYNKRPHISRCLSSVLTQTYDKFQLIIIDDNSNDGSFEEIQRFKDQRIEVFRRKKAGPGGYAARNLGIQKAKAEWIAFLDADDEWFSDHLENIYKVIQKYPNVGIIGAGYISKTDSVETIQPYYASSKNIGTHTINFSEFLKIYLKGHRFGNTSVVAATKEALLSVSMFPEGKTNKGGDLYLWIKIFANYLGAWSPHIGAITYGDSVNKVTSNAYFDIAFLKSVTQEVNISDKEMILLKKYINSLIYKDYFRHINRKGEKPFVIHKVSFIINKVNYSKMYLIDLIPASFYKALISLKRKLK